MPLLRSSWMISASLVGAFGSLIFVDLRKPTAPKFSVLVFLPSMSSRCASANSLIWRSRRLVASMKTRLRASASAFASSILFCIAASKFSTVR